MKKKRRVNRLSLSPRQSGKAILNLVNRSPDEQYSTSISLPNWQRYRIKAAKKKLKENGIKMSNTEIISACIRILAKKVRRHKVCNTTRVRRKNPTVAKYKKVSVQWEAEVYNILLMLADHARVCHSVMADIALRMYLEIVLKTLIAEGKGKVEICFIRHRDIKVVKSHKRIDTLYFAGLINQLYGIYRRRTWRCTSKSLIYSSSWIFM
ncbi:MAG: hypothetical protein D6767_07595 [Candidatus Hydrogenedentota bacterium]|nr:MAG: hypothetical protein D6767_07595 [Candidatus Hydrogenedentota bacterium]